MDSDNLTPTQARLMHTALEPYVGYLAMLAAGMDAGGFPHDDELLKMVRRASDTANRLFIELHYRACTDGVAWRRG